MAKQLEGGKSFGDVVIEARANQSQSSESRPGWKDTVKKQFGLTSDTPETPPKAPAPADAAAAAQQRGQSKGRTQAPPK